MSISAIVALVVLAFVIGAALGGWNGYEMGWNAYRTMWDKTTKSRSRRIMRALAKREEKSHVQFWG